MGSQYPTKPLLIVDNEEAWINSLGFALEYVGGISHYRSCTDSRDVIDILADKAFSLIILDLSMPHLTGEEILSHIQRHYPETPTIILSGLDDSETEERCMENGASAFLSKTTPIERIIDTVRGLVE